MKAVVEYHSIQKLVSGDDLHITSHVFTGSEPGPNIYIQGNIHGPEIFGTALLIKLLQRLEHIDSIKGKITAVPLANPLGVQAQTYGLIHGRWNAQTGNDWNRIFSKTQGDGVEATLARTLLSISGGHDIVLDIHTSGSEAIPHVYTTKEHSDTFNTLHTPYHIIYGPKDYYGAFDETVWKNGKKKGTKVATATWEASSHLTLEEKTLEEQLENLLSWLSSCGAIKELPNSTPHPKKILMKNVKWHPSPRAGYLTWIRSVGEVIAKEEAYANIYEPWSGNVEQLRASHPMIFLSKGTLQAISAGHIIGKIIEL